MSFTRNLYLTSPMMNGTDVQEVQTKLNQLGYNCGTADGWFGTLTNTAVRNFQSAKGLVVDGIVGINTWNTLFSTSSGGSGSKQISDAGVLFIANYETFSGTAYRGADSQNLTIGYGHVIVSGDGLNANSVLTKQQALALLNSDLKSRVNTVNTLTSGINLSQNQFDSLVSFQFNTGSLGSSTLLKDVKAGASLSTIKTDFNMWVYCNGEVLLGLQRRRLDEWEMYASGDYTRTY